MVDFVRLVMPLLLIVAALSGCAAKDADETVVNLGDGQQVEIKEAAGDQVSGGKGAVSGVVVDEAIRPIEGATVAVSGVADPATSDENGLFLVTGLDPGLYTLQVGGAGFQPIQTSAEVMAGETTKVRIVLLPDTTPRPYHITYSFDWYDQASAGSADFAIDLANREILNNSLPPMCDVCYFDITTDGPVEALIIEALWQDSVPKPTGATNYYWVLENHGPEGGFVGGYFSNPGRAEVPGGKFPTSTSFGLGLSTDENWVSYQQKAQVFVTAFYLTAPPEGWSFVAGDT